MLFSGAKVQLFRGKQNFSQLFHHFTPHNHRQPLHLTAKTHSSPQKKQFATSHFCNREGRERN